MSPPAATEIEPAPRAVPPQDDPPIRARPPAEASPAPPASLAWRSWPLREEGPRAALLVAIIGGLSLGIGISFESAWWGGFSATLLSAFLAPYLAPTDIALDARGVRVRFLWRESARPWSEVRGLYSHREGVHLSPFARPSPLDSFRGIFLRFSGGNHDEVKAFCERHLRARPG